jgi:hypothetical protein
MRVGVFSGFFVGVFSGFFFASCGGVCSADSAKD